MKTNLGRDIPICLMITFILAALLFPVFAQTKNGKRPYCLPRIKQSSVALQIYNGDHNDRFPHRDEWVDAAYPYTKSWDILRCPGVPKGGWGFAFNGALSLNKLPAKPETVPLIYDSVNPTKNASDLVASLPAVPRHGRNAMSYADGHAKMLPANVVK